MYEKERKQLGSDLDRIKNEYPDIESLKTRLRFLCTDMIERLKDESSNFECRIQEAGLIALALEYDHPPIQHLKYHRDNDSNIFPPSQHFPIRESVDWIIYEHQHPEMVYVVGFRINDPTGGPGRDIHCSAIVDCNDPNRSKQVPILLGNAHEVAHSRISESLQLWIRDIDGMQDNSEPVTSNIISENTNIESDDSDVPKDFSDFTWNGQRHTYAKMQAAAMSEWYNAYKRGNPDLQDETVLCEIGSQVDDRSRGISYIFKGHPALGSIIIRGARKGTHRLVDEIKLQKN